MNTLLICLVSGLMIMGLSGCSDIKAPDPIRLPPNELIYKLRFTTRAVMIQSYDTITLKTIATFADGSQTAVNSKEIVWRSVDPGLVSVDSNGKIRTFASTTGSINIIASYTDNGITKADTIPIYISQAKLEANEIKIEILDSTTVGALAINGTPKIRVDLYQDGVVSKEGAQVPVTVPPGIVVTQIPATGYPDVFWSVILNNKGILGKFYIHASLNLYGNEVRDSIEFTGVYSGSLLVPTFIQNMDGVVTAAGLKPGDPMKYVQPCAIVKFLMLLPLITKPVDLVFSDSLPSGDRTCEEIPNADLKPGGTLVRANQIWGNATGITGPGVVMVVRRSPTIGQITYYLRDAITKDSLGITGRYTQR